MHEINQFLKDEITLIQLFEIAEYKGLKVATEKQIKDALNNNFMLSVLADENKIKKDILVFKLRVILEKVQTEK